MISSGSQLSPAVLAGPGALAIMDFRASPDALVGRLFSDEVDAKHMGSLPLLQCCPVLSSVRRGARRPCLMDFCAFPGHLFKLICVFLIFPASGFTAFRSRFVSI